MSQNSQRLGVLHFMDDLNTDGVTVETPEEEIEEETEEAQ
jgi:hypothetical protein